MRRARRDRPAQRRPLVTARRVGALIEASAGGGASLSQLAPGSRRRRPRERVRPRWRRAALDPDGTTSPQPRPRLAAGAARPEQAEGEPVAVTAILQRL